MPTTGYLGLVGTNIAVRLHQAGVVYEGKRDTFTGRSTLIALAPQTWWCGLCGTDKMTSDMSMMLGDSIIRAADQLGQIDQALFWGRGAVRLPDRRIVYHLGDRLLIDGRVAWVVG